MPLEGYVDADFAHDINTRRSTTGYGLFLFGNIVSWSSRKQSLIAQSSTEAEYVALAACLNEVKWLRNLLLCLKVVPARAILIFEDNQNTISIAYQGCNKKTKAIDVKFRLCEQLIEEGIIKIVYVDSKSQTADIFTKSLPPSDFKIHCNKIFIT